MDANRRTVRPRHCPLEVPVGPTTSDPPRRDDSPDVPITNDRPGDRPPAMLRGPHSLVDDALGSPGTAKDPQRLVADQHRTQGSTTVGLAHPGWR